jgi:orotidine-5'-phosphate decarboxylase
MVVCSGGGLNQYQRHGADAVKHGAAHAQRVCRAWHRASEVQVLAPGVRAAEGEEQGKGVTVRWGLKEAQSKDAGRRTGTG